MLTVKPDPSRLVMKTWTDPNEFTDTSRRIHQSPSDQILPDSTVLNRDKMYHRVEGRPKGSEEEYCVRFQVLPPVFVLVNIGTESWLCYSKNEVLSVVSFRVPVESKSFSPLSEVDNYLSRRFRVTLLLFPHFLTWGNVGLWNPIS